MDSQALKATGSVCYLYVMPIHHKFSAGVSIKYFTVASFWCRYRKVGNIPLMWANFPGADFLGNPSQVQKEREKSSSLTNVILAFSRGSRAVTAKKCTKKCDAREKLLLLLLFFFSRKVLLFGRSFCRRRRRCLSYLMLALLR